MKKQTLMVVAMGMLAVAGVGCGGDGDSGPAAKPGTVNPTQARAATAQATMLNSAISSMNGSALSNAAISLSTSGSSIVSPGTGQALVAAPDVLNQSGTADCTATGCTYNNYTVGNFTINGSVQATAAGEGTNKVTWNLTMKGTNVGGGSTGGISSFDYKATGDVTVSATSINGEATGNWSGSSMTQGYNITYKFTSLVRFMNVTLNAEKCPTGGSLYAKWSTEIGGIMGAEQANQAYEGTQTFSGCQ